MTTETRLKFRPIRSDRLSDKVAEQLLEKIHSGELAPGSRLPSETELADQLEISRGVIREALTILQAQGYIRRRPKEGTFIEETLPSKTVTLPIGEILRDATYFDLIEFREAMELKIAELVIERATDEEIAGLVAAAEDLAEDDRTQRTIDHYFHYRMAELTKNNFFMNFIDTYYDLISEIAEMGHTNQVRRIEIMQEHLAIATAIRRRDRRATSEAVQNHIRRLKASMARKMKKGGADGD